MKDSRRKFIKNLYKTPIIFTLGSLAGSNILYADASGGPDGPPGGGFGKIPNNKKRKKLKF